MSGSCGGPGKRRSELEHVSAKFVNTLWFEGRKNGDWGTLLIISLRGYVSGT